MIRTGSADLPLHDGRAPQWLYKKMRILGGQIATLIVEDKGKVGLLERLSNPIWFQGLGCLLGFDWHSSGLTTVTMSALRDSFNELDLGLKVVGGKGNFAKIPFEIEEQSDILGVTENRISEFKRASKLSAKVDSTAIQDGFSLYHHTLVLSEDGSWAVIQQGMHAVKRLARRYHWYSGTYGAYTDDPYQEVVGDSTRINVLNTVNGVALENQKAMLDLVCDRTFINKMKDDSLRNSSLDSWLDDVNTGLLPVHVSFPLHVNWKLLNRLYESRLNGYEDLLTYPGIGPKAIRALALAAEIIYGVPAVWKDPIKYSYAHGGKDGVPFPVDRRLYDSTISELKQLIDATGIINDEKKRALKRLGGLLAPQ